MINSYDDYIKNDRIRLKKEQIRLEEDYNKLKNMNSFDCQQIHEITQRVNNIKKTLNNIEYTCEKEINEEIEVIQEEICLASSIGIFDIRHEIENKHCINYFIKYFKNRNFNVRVDGYDIWINWEKDKKDKFNFFIIVGICFYIITIIIGLFFAFSS